MPRHDGRAADEPRPLKIQRNYLGAAPGRVLISTGVTTVLCTASVSDTVPPWLAGRGKGWVTAEYSMLPGSTSPRKSRDKGKPDGRSTEIQRLIGRSLRAGIDMTKLGERLITVDCDVLQADGGTRTAGITGGWVALIDAIRSINEEDGSPAFNDANTPVVDSVAALSVGVVAGEAVADLDYAEDSTAEVDMNLVMTGDGRYVEVQGSAEGAPFTPDQLSQMLSIGAKAIARVTAAQAEALA
ncbi:MAG: ribonuclease PH [Planctomycetota bacterium]